MRTHNIHSLAGFALLLAAASVSAAAAGPRTNAVASFTSHDAGGCISTETSVSVHKAGGSRDRLELRVLKVNECSGAGIMDVRIDQSIPAGSFRVTANQSAAWLSVSLPVEDSFSRKRSSATIAIRWSAQEEAVSAMSAEEPIALGKFKRSAKAVKRTIRLGGASGTIRLSGGASVALGAAESAWIGRAEGGS